MNNPQPQVSTAALCGISKAALWVPALVYLFLLPKIRINERCGTKSLKSLNHLSSWECWYLRLEWWRVHLSMWCCVARTMRDARWMGIALPLPRRDDAPYTYCTGFPNNTRYISARKKIEDLLPGAELHFCRLSARRTPWIKSNFGFKHDGQMDGISVLVVFATGTLVATSRYDYLNFFFGND